MVFGIGEGSIEIQLPKFNYTQGETIKGKLVLKLNAPKKARELRVELVAERRITQTRIGTSGRRTHTSIERVYEFKLPLRGEGEFTSSEYDFELQVPKFSAAVPGEVAGTPEGIGAVVRTLLSLPSPPSWYVIGVLDIPLSLDITKKVQISVV